MGLLRIRHSVVIPGGIRLTVPIDFNILYPNIMDFRSRSFRGFTGAAMLAAAFLSGCAAVPAGPAVAESAEAAIARRAQQRWDALIASDVPKAYGYLSPGSRQSTSLAGYTATLKLGTWRKAAVQRVDCKEPDLCEVHLKIDYQVRGAALATPLLETWTKVGNEWWYVLK